MLDLVRMSSQNLTIRCQIAWNDMVFGYGRCHARNDTLDFCYKYLS